MKRLTTDELPKEIRDYYENEGIHKALKKGTSTIVVHTRTQRTDVWYKMARVWMLKPKQYGSLTVPKLGPPYDDGLPAVGTKVPYMHLPHETGTRPRSREHKTPPEE